MHPLTIVNVRIFHIPKLHSLRVKGPREERKRERERERETERDRETERQRDRESLVKLLGPERCLTMMSAIPCAVRLFFF